MRSVVELLQLHEGLRLFPYVCTGNAWSIGYGHNLDVRPIGISIDMLRLYGISPEGAQRLLIQDIQRCVQELETIDEYQYLDEVRRAVLLDMCFNLGFAGLLKFNRMWAALTSSNWDNAAYEMMASRWAHQVKTRAYRLADMMRTGDWPDDV